MRRIVIGAVVAVIFSGMVLIGSGCFNKKKAGGGAKGVSTAAKTTTGSVLKDLGTAPASEVVAANLKPFFTSGWVLLVVGGLLAAVGARSTGVMVVGVGVFSVFTGTLLAQYPWMALVIAAAALCAGGMEVVSRFRTRNKLAESEAEKQKSHDALAIVAEATQTAKGGKEVKAAIRNMGPDAVRTVRAVIDPIKEELGEQGKIKAA